MLSFVCRDAGKDCPFWAEAWTEEELMEKILSHARDMHHINPVPASLKETCRRAIRNASAARRGQAPRPNTAGMPSRLFEDGQDFAGDEMIWKFPGSGPRNDRPGTGPQPAEIQG